VTAWHTGGDTPDSLRPFTSTAQVPVVAGPRYGPEGAVPRAVRRRPAPLWLRLAVWGTALLVLAGVAGIAVHKVRPSALASLEPGPARPAAATHPTRPPATVPAPHKPTTSDPVVETPTGSQAATVQVDTARYTVTVAPQDRCWVQVTGPTSTTPQFAGVMAAGQQQTFHPVNGQLGVDLGASHVTVSVTLAGQSTPAWQFTPAAAPFTLSFTSTSH
jgi:hypothetical protein